MCATLCKTQANGKEDKRRKNRLSAPTLRRRKEEKAMYTEYGYIKFDGIEYATEQEAYEAYVEHMNEPE